MAPALAQAHRFSRALTGGVSAVAGGTRAGRPATGSAGGAQPRRHVRGAHRGSRNHRAGHRRRAGSKGRSLNGPLSEYAPITARQPTFEYSGPVFELTAAGQIVPYLKPPAPGEVSQETGGIPVGVAADSKPQLLVPGRQAEPVEGLAAAPMAAPHTVQEMIWAANRIVGRPYVYGGGHGSFKSYGYDCSGTVSFALHGGKEIKTPMDSSEMMRWGEHGIGKWVTIFANPGHAYMTIAGIRLDTSTANDPSNLQGPRWRPLRPENAGFVRRHPEGL